MLKYWGEGMNIIKFYTAELKSEENKELIELNEEIITDDVKKQIEEFLKYCDSKIATVEGYDIHDTNLPKQWKRHILKMYLNGNYEELAYLLYDEFTDRAIACSGKGYNKYISIVFADNCIYIIHTSKLDGVGKPKKSKNISIIFNILTRANLIRFIKLVIESNKILVYAWEREKTQHFRKFLGFDIDEYEDLGNITFYLRSIKNKFFEIKFEIFADDLINHVIKGDILINHQRKILKIGDEEYEIIKITSKNELKQKTYKDIKEFYNKLFMDYNQITSELYKIVKKYCSTLHGHIKGIDNKDSYDDKDYIVISGKRYSKEGVKLILLAGFKSRTCELRFREDYLNYLNEEILLTILENKQLPICHILEEFFLDGIDLGCLKIYNRITIDGDIDNFKNLYQTLSECLIKYKKSEHIRDMIYLTILNYYKLFLDDTKFSYFFDSLIRNYISSIDYGYFGYLDYEDSIIEYKEQTWWSNKPKEQKDRISELINKLNGKEVPIFITIVGFSEKSRRITQIKGQIPNDDTITELTEYGNKELKDRGLNYKLDFILPIEYKNGYILLIVFKRDSL